MRLSTRLLLSHLAPLVIVILALGLALVALLRMTSALDALERTELVALRREGDLHRAAWTLDVSMRHGEDDCGHGSSPVPIRARIVDNMASVRKALAETDPITATMKKVVEGYLAVATDVVAADLCAGLQSDALGNRREALDEELTNLWIARLDELHDQVTEKKEDARRIGRTALFGGVLVAIASSLFAIFVAGRLMRVVNQPLRALGHAAQRVGRGDFSTPVVVGGPREFGDLGAELERMRVQLEQLEVLKQGFLASISHELRTPLSKIREALALLRDGVVGPMGDRQLDVVRIAQTACEREIRMVTTLLDLSRLRAGSPVRLRDGSSIDDVILHAVEDERFEAEARGVEVTFSQRGEATSLRIDPVLVERAIANLVRNAVAVSTSGQRVDVTRSVVSGERDGASRWIRIRVSDEGPGVAQELGDQVFEAFVTRPVPNSPKSFGFGLGLALARDIARAHGGELELDRAVKRGASFVLWLPAGPTEPPTAGEPHAVRHHRP